MKREPLSHAMLRMLESTRRSHDPYAHIFGSAAHGGATKTMHALCTRGLIEVRDRRFCCTKEGLAALRRDRQKRR